MSRESFQRASKEMLATSKYPKQSSDKLYEDISTEEEGEHLMDTENTSDTSPAISGNISSTEYIPKKKPSKKSLSFLQNMNSRFARTRESILLKMGKPRKSSDLKFDSIHANFTAIQRDVMQYYKDFKHFYGAAQNFQNCQNILLNTIKDIYDPGWVEWDQVQVKSEAMETVFATYIESLKTTVMDPIEIYIRQLHRMSWKISRRDRTLLDFEASKSLLSKKRKKSQDNMEIRKAEKNVTERKKSYDAIHSELMKEIPNLYTNRSFFFGNNFFSLFSANETFHKIFVRMFSDLSKGMLTLTETGYRRSLVDSALNYKVFSSSERSKSSPSTLPVAGCSKDDAEYVIDLLSVESSPQISTSTSPAAGTTKKIPRSNNDENSPSPLVKPEQRIKLDALISDESFQSSGSSSPVVEMSKKKTKYAIDLPSDDSFPSSGAMSPVEEKSKNNPKVVNDFMPDENFQSSGSTSQVVEKSKNKPKYDSDVLSDESFTTGSPAIEMSKGKPRYASDSLYDESSRSTSSVEISNAPKDTNALLYDERFQSSRSASPVEESSKDKPKDDNDLLSDESFQSSRLTSTPAKSPKEQLESDIGLLSDESLPENSKLTPLTAERSKDTIGLYPSKSLLQSFRTSPVEQSNENSVDLSSEYSSDDDVALLLSDSDPQSSTSTLFTVRKPSDIFELVSPMYKSRLHVDVDDTSDAEKDSTDAEKDSSDAEKDSSDAEKDSSDKYKNNK